MPPPYHIAMMPHFRGTSGSIASDGPGNANAALYVPVYFPESASLTAINVIFTNGGNNYDLGLYTSAYVRVASKGSTATSAGVHTLSLSSVTVSAGDAYYVGIATDNIGIRLLCYTYSSTAFVLQAGCTEQASALPLPATATPTTSLSWQHLPVISIRCA